MMKRWRISMKFKTIGISTLTFCSLLTISVSVNAHNFHRAISSLSYSIETIEVLNPENANGFIKIELSSKKNLIKLKSLLEKTLQNHEQLSKSNNVDKDYFKSVKTALGQINKLTSDNLSFEESLTSESYNQIADIFHSLRNRFKNPFTDRVELLTIPFLLAEYTHRPEIEVPRDNKMKTIELSPLSDNTFNTEIKRPRLHNPDEAICTYLNPKSGYGYKAGFKATCSGQKMKIKFGNESLSGPFNSRIFRSLGYLTPRIDSINNFRMKYDRRYFAEFNSQKKIDVDLKLLGLKLKTIHAKRSNRDPFSYIKNVTLKDSTVLNAEEFKNKLLANNTFDERFENEIDFITFEHASITEKLDVVSVGPWSFNENHHRNNSQIRQGVILSAWVGNVDIHMGNNQLVIENYNDPEQSKVTPIFLDVGYGLGKTDSALSNSSSDIADMGWDISTLVKNETDGPYTEKVVLTGFISQQYNHLLSDLTFKDVFLALKNICRINKQQIKTALIESGASEELAELGTRKLLHRRSKLIHDFDIQNQFKSCYEPQKKIYN